MRSQPPSLDKSSLDARTAAIESQAFGRVHRMGQLKDVKIYKITVDNTIEDR